MKKYVINKRNIERWKNDVQKSVVFYNDWFLNGMLQQPVY